MDDVKQTASAPLEEVLDPQPAAPALEEKADAAISSDAWGRVRDLALRHLDRLMSFEPKVLQGDDPDAIHDIRVASRRLQQVLNLLYPQPRPKEVQRLRRLIRRCRRALGEVRNCDVMLQRIEKSLARKHAAKRGIWTAVRHYLLERRARSFQKALRKLSKLNLAVFYVHLKECLSPNGVAASRRHFHTLAAPDRAAAENFHESTTQALERVWNAFENQMALSHQDPRPPVIHGVRIAAKRLRYLVEVVHEFNVPGSAETLAWLRQLQQHLGDWHDLQVLEQMLIEMVARPEFLRDHLDLAMGVEKLMLANRAARQDYEERYLQMTGDSEGFGRVKEWVGYVLASPSAAFART